MDETCSEMIFIRNSERPEGLFIKVKASPIKNIDGLTLGGVAYFRDVTKSIIAENNLRQSERRLKSLFMEIPMPTYVWQKQDDDFILIDFNHSAETITNGQIVNFQGQKLSVIYPDRPEVIDDFNNCFSKQTSIVREMTIKLRSTGEVKNFIVTYIFVEPDLIMVHTHDITKKVTYEKELKKLSNAVEQTADVILITDKHGIIEYVNRAFEDTYGYKASEVIGKTPRLLKSGYHDKEFYKNMWNTILSKDTFKATMLNKKKDGSKYWVEQTISPILDNDGEILNFVSVKKDITELRRRIEKELELLKSDNLLLNILPEPIAGRLKNGETLIADQYSDASIIFIDIVGFTKLFSKSNPKSIVIELNRIFTMFDKLSEKYGIEKIKTLGDCYMAVSGIPVPRLDHAQSIALMAIEAMEVMRDYKTADGHEIQFRIGIDCGPVVAGVIGERKFIYDLWGEAVNTASRMKDFGVVDKIQCTERFMKKLSAPLPPEFPELLLHFTEREEIEIKGMGKMRPYFLSINE
jgi:PAS domain S-box-containing protein